MRFFVRVSPDWLVTITHSEGRGLVHPRDGQPLPPRQLRRRGEANKGSWPFAPEPQHLPSPDDLLHPVQDADELASIRERISSHLPKGKDAERFGLYLFDTLLGRTAWQAIVKAADGQEFIELALCWSIAEKDLGGFNWELMHGSDEDGFLAAGLRNVAITRVLAGTDDKKWDALPIPYPPRVLFVVGTSWTEPDVRPGAECLGLLRQLEERGRGIQSLVLQRARESRLQRLLETFRPHVVHFICHGRVDALTGEVVLQLEKDNQPEGGKATQDYSADQLAKQLRVDGWTPTIVVLSACYSGGEGEVHLLDAPRAAPLAARLVHEGVPVVIGMAGEVSDDACRLFARQFGRALLGGESLVKATMQGRWTAFANQQRPYLSVHWALPAVFLAEKVRPDFAPVLVPEEPKDKGKPPLPIDDRVNTYDVRRGPVFCGRDDFFATYHELFHQPAGGLFSVLAVYTEDTKSFLGRTRLLQELTARAVRDGHIPCLVGSDSPKWSPPTTRAAFARAVFDAITQARKAFGLALRFSSQLRLLLATPEDRKAALDLHADLRYLLDTDGEVSAGAVRLALELDLAVLRNDVRGEYPSVRDAGGQVLVLLDKVDGYGEAVDDLFARGLLNAHGLGTAAVPVPVILVFSLEGPAKDTLVKVKDNNSPVRPWLRPMALGLFQKDGEDLLAYERILLLHRSDLVPAVSRKGWAINWRVPKETFAQFQQDAREVLDGRPCSYFSKEAYTVVLFASKAEEPCIVPADDETALARLVERWPGLKEVPRP